VRLYDRRLIEFIDSIPKGLRSPVIQAALNMYCNTGPPNPAAILEVDGCGYSLGEATLNNDSTNPLARLKGDF